MSGPQRLRRRRSAGWRMPAGAVYVGRPTRWGNPWAVSRRPGDGGMDRAEATARYRERLLADRELLAAVRCELAGRDLVCWCPPDQPCHADVLLELANRR